MEEKQRNALEMEKPSLTMNEVCELLSISRDTAKNWIRLGKMTPDVENQEFSREYMDNFLSEIRSDNNRKLKSRRNKKKAAGKILYKEYIHTEENRELVKDLLELGIIQSEKDLRMVLADFAVQLYYQSRGIGYSKGPVLVDFLSQKEFQDFRILVQDLLGPQSLDGDRVNRLLPALEKDIHYVQGEDSLGFVYISLRDIGQRKSTGAYYTPEKVMDELIENLMENLHKTGKEGKQRTICDPCCGSGNFLLRLGTQGMDCSRLYGQDMDPVSVYLARINMALADPRLSASDLQSQMIIGNTLFETFDQKFDVILGNPPWGSEFSPEDTWKCRRLFRTAAGTGMEAYDLLIEKALTMLNPNGILAFVLPEAVLSVASHKAVRRWLIDTCSFQFVSYLGNAFSGVQCPAIILGVTPDQKPTAVGCRVTTKNKSFVIAHERSFDDGILSLHVSDEEYACLHAICTRKNIVYLKGNAKFALGIVTGSNREMISKEKRDGYEVILKGNDIQRYGIKESNNFIRFTPEDFQQTAPAAMYRAKEKLLYRFISEVPVFAYDDHQTLSLNSCNILIPEIPGLEMKYVLAILNSSAAAFFTLKKFNSVKLLRSHIEQIPIPLAEPEIQAAIVKKVDEIMDASENISERYEDLDRDIMEIFALSDGQIQTIQETLKGKKRFLKV